MSIKAFHLFGEIGLKNKASAELHKVDRDVHRTSKNLGSLTGAMHVPGGTLSSMNSALGTLSNISNTIQGIPVIGSLISGAVSTIAGPIKDLAQLGLGFNDLKENATLAFGVILKDGERATKLFDKLAELGKTSPIFNTGEMVKSSQRLLPILGDGAELFDAIKGIGAMVAVTGDLSRMPDVFRSMTAIARKPKLSSEEMSHELPDHGVDAWGLLARARGQTVGEVQALVEKGLISGMGAFKVMIAQSLREFGPIVDVMGQSRTGKQLQIDDTTEQLAGKGTENLHATWKQGQDRVLAGLQGPQGAALANQINQTTGVIGDKVLGGFDALLDGSLLGKMQKAGEDAKAGISQGFEGVKTGLGNAVEYVTGFKTGIGSNSAATEFIPLGQDAAAGFLIGFDSHMIAAGAPMSLFNKKGGGSLGGGREDAQSRRRAENETLLRHPAVQAMMDAIGVGEGTFNPKTGERNWMKWFGNARLTPTAEHPGISPVPFFNKKTGKWDKSSAAGGGQFLERTWTGVEQDIGNLDFNNLHHQALAFVEKMRDRRMIGALLRGDARTAMTLGNEEWASLPGSPHKQPTVKESTVIDTFNKRFGFYSGAGASITNATPIPVTIIAGDVGTSREATTAAQAMIDARKAATTVQAMIDARKAATTAQAMIDARKAVTTADAMRFAQESAKLAASNPQALKAMDQALKLTEGSLTKAAPAVEKLGSSAALTAEQIDANKKLSDLPGTATATPGKAFESMFTKEGVAGDFQGGFTSLLSGLGWEKPTSLLKQFGLGMIRDIQGRLASDLSSMFTGSLFGNTDKDGKRGGGLLSSIFGSLFGGGRASGGGMSAGRFYMAGEHGVELVAGPGHVYNNRETRGMMGGGGEQRTLVYFGPHELGRAVSDFGTTSQGRRARVIQAKWGRKLQTVSY